MSDIIKALEEYSKQFYSTVNMENGNTIASPLGSWLLVASTAASLDYSSNDEAKLNLEKWLHMDIVSAAETVKEILNKYPELNYVTKAWSNTDIIDRIPSIGHWVEKNELIPHESIIPSVEELNAWVKDNTNSLIQEFPTEIDETTALIIANIIYSKFSWANEFNVIGTTPQMAFWGVQNILHARESFAISLLEDEEGRIFARYSVRGQGAGESVALMTCLTEELPPRELIASMYHSDKMTRIRPENYDALNLDPTVFRFKETSVNRLDPFAVDVYLPSWEAESNFDLIENTETGMGELLEAFRVGALDDVDMEAKQVAAAKFDYDGFEAAALTAITVVARASLPSLKDQKVYELNFSRPFAVTSYLRDLPVFSGFISRAKEAK